MEYLTDPLPPAPQPPALAWTLVPGGRARNTSRFTAKLTMLNCRLRAVRWSKNLGGTYYYGGHNLPPWLI